MVSPYQYIQDKPQTARGVIGIDYENFKELCVLAEERYKQRQEEIEKDKIRVNKQGGGRSHQLAIPEQICLSLVYLRHLPTFEMLGILFDVSRSTANATFRTWVSILRDLLPASLLEDVEKGYREAEEVASDLQNDKILVDSTEQARERPGDYQTPKNTIPARRSSIP